MPDGGSPVVIIEALLKYPGRIIHELQHNWRAALSAWLLVLALIGMSIYGLVVGSFSGGSQMWIAPAKLALGTLALHPDLSAEPLHFRLSQRNRCPVAHSQRRPLRRDLSWRVAAHRIRAGRVDIFSID